MITARLENPDNPEQGSLLLIVLEPGNLDRLRVGKGIHVHLNELFPELTRRLTLEIGFAPDALWMEKAIRAMVAGEGEIQTLNELFLEAHKRPEVRR